MKTIEQVNLEIKDLENQVIAKEANSEKKASRLRNKITEKRFAILYLEQSPSDEFLKSERKKIEDKINTINEACAAHMETSDERNDIKELFCEKIKEQNDLKKLKKQFSTLNYLILE